MPDPTHPSTAAKDSTVVLFMVAGHPYGVPALRTREVLSWRRPRPLPGAAPWIEGVINLRGEIVPVCDLAHALGLATDHRRAPESSILIIEMNEGRDCVGFTVDEVRAVTSYGAADIVEARGAEHAAMEGIVRAGDELVVLLDLARALAGAEDGIDAALALHHVEDLATSTPTNDISTQPNPAGIDDDGDIPGTERIAA